MDSRRARFQLDPGETVLKRVGHHWIYIFKLSCLAIAVLVLAYFFVYVYIHADRYVPPFVPSIVVLAIALALAAIAPLMFFVGLWIFHNNFVLLTNLHLIQVEQSGLFRSQTDQVSLGRIQDVSGVRPGILATVLNYGTLTVQSAGEQRQFVIRYVPAPQIMADQILKLHEDFLAANPNSGG